ncbi:MAG: L-threonylcarbamoyladenylate synthase [Lachnospiraceae bacterium]|nr:L-threonylcarbamoyladenylate synthase [Lachnospiraceae bacterium]
MKTRIIRLDEENIDRTAVEEAGRVIRAGGLVAFPTETVYGLGGDALNAESSGRIYAAKGRPSDNPLIVHIADLEGLKKVVAKIPEEALLLAERFWPGPLTMIFEKADVVPYATTGGLDTVAVRMPSNKIARELIRASGRYLAAPSANLSGRPSPTDAKYVIQDLDGRVDMILDGGESEIGLESTIIDLSGEAPVILRPGYITEEMLKAVIAGVDTDWTILDTDSGTAPKAPGMKYRHYAPKGSLVLVEGAQEQVVSYINGRLEAHRKEGKRTGVIAADETAPWYRADSVKSVGKRGDESAIAKHLFRILREFDDEEVQMIYAESFDRRGIGCAIMNRLLKAAGHQVITL